jgi:ubiquinone/menaquinone biosynthesis C-methylase UbiE
MQGTKQIKATGSEASVWSHLAESYDQSRQEDAVYSSCIEMVAYEIPNGTKLCLEGGCGTGLSTMVFSAKCNQVIAVDYSYESLKVLKNKGIENVTLVQADLAALPFKNFVFDICVCANTLQHFKPNDAQKSAIHELKRVANEKGFLCVSVHHYSKSKQKAGWIKEGKPGQAGIDYIFRFTRDDLRKLIPDSLIRAVGYYGFLKIPFFGSHLQNLLGVMFGRISALLGYGHMLIAVTKVGQ